MKLIVLLSLIFTIRSVSVAQPIVYDNFLNILPIKPPEAPPGFEPIKLPEMKPDYDDEPSPLLLLPSELLKIILP